MATGTLAPQIDGRTRRLDSPATVTIIQRGELQQCSASAVSSDAVTSGDYVITLARVEELHEEENEEDRPSERAYTFALKVLADTARELTLDFPRASVSVGPNRGLRITWSRGDGEVRLVCGGSDANRSYIYSESGSQRAPLENIVEGKRLAQLLRWALREA